MPKSERLMYDLFSGPAEAFMARVHRDDSITIEEGAESLTMIYHEQPMLHVERKGDGQFTARFNKKYCRVSDIENPSGRGKPWETIFEASLRSEWFSRGLNNDDDVHLWIEYLPYMKLAIQDWAAHQAD